MRMEKIPGDPPRWVNLDSVVAADVTRKVIVESGQGPFVLTLVLPNSTAVVSDLEQIKHVAAILGLRDFEVYQKAP